MATELSEKTKITLDLKTIGIVVGGAISIASLYFVMQADIALAKTLPVPPISKIEYELKDELIRQTIMDTQDDVEEIKETLKKIDERLYNLIPR
jgi:copper chaperone CopZ